MAQALKKHFAYATMTVKAATQDASGRRTFTGIASTIATDRMDDIVVPKGAKFKLPMPLLSQHKSSEPIGWVVAARVTDNQIEVDCVVHNETEPGKLKDRLDERWQEIKAGLVAGLSIGFNPIEYSRIDGSYGLKFLAWEWLELSTVTIAANQEASITTIKSLDRENQRAALGHKTLAIGRDVTPGASGKTGAASRGNDTHRSPKGNTTMKTLKEMREERAQKQARLTELVELRKAESRPSTDEEFEESEALASEIRGLSDDILEAEMHRTNVKSATEVDGTNTARASASRGNNSARTDVRNAKEAEDKFKGQGFTRQVIAKALAHQYGVSASSIAEKRWGKTNPMLVQIIRANEVPGGGTDSGEWGAELVGVDNRYNGDFIEFIYAMTVFDKLGLREAPANVAVKGQDGAASAKWVGQSKAIAVTKPDFSSINLVPLKVAALAVVSNELLRDSTPAAEALVRDALAEASAQRIDQTFLSTDAASAGVSPAGMLNGLTALHITGTDGVAVRNAIKALYASFLQAKTARGLRLVMNPAMAKAIGLIVNALGQTEFPGLNADGGTLLGDPVVTGDNVDPSHIILLDPKDIYKIADSGVQIAISRDAMIEQNSQPTGATDTPVAASQTFTSMFQEDSTAIRVIRSINFQKRRATAVAYIDDADFDGTVS